MYARRNRSAVRFGAMACVALAACSGEDESAATGRAMEVASPVTEKQAPSSALNSAPVIEAVMLSPRNPRPGENITANVRATDSDGDAIDLRFEWQVDGHATGSTGSIFRATGEKASRIEVVVVASDGVSQSPAARASVRVGDSPPVLQGIVIEPLGAVTRGDDLVASPRASDPDGDTISYRYRWEVNGETVRTSGSLLSADHFRRGDRIRVTVWAKSSQGESEPLRSDTIEVVNATPEITSTPGAIGQDGVFRYRVTAEDPDGDRSFRYRLLEAPEGMKLDVVDGALSWTPEEAQSGEHSVKIEVADPSGGAAIQSFVITVGFEDVPAAPADS